MAYLEKLLPEFRNGAKIRCKYWRLDMFIQNIDDDDIDIEDLPRDDWELYQEPIDWGYIIKNKCLCWFWDDINSLEESSYGYLILYNEYTQRYYNGKKWYKNCRPVRKDEVSFYEDIEVQND